MEHPNIQQDESLFFMEKAITKLKTLPLQMRNEDYKTIVELIDNYIQKHCNHIIVTDLIDIDPDRSKMVKYCECCYKTFN